VRDDNTSYVTLKLLKLTAVNNLRNLLTQMANFHAVYHKKLVALITVPCCWITNSTFHHYCIRLPKGKDATAKWPLEVVITSPLHNDFLDICIDEFSHSSFADSGIRVATNLSQQPSLTTHTYINFHFNNRFLD